MCGRFTLIADEKSIKNEFGIQVSQFKPIEQYNIAPGIKIPVIRYQDKIIFMDLLVWGLIPFWAKDPKASHRPINARSESILEKPTFRLPFQKQRCLIPASGFYEWDEKTKPKQPYYFHLEDKPLFAFAGIWDTWESPEGENIKTCCLITKAASENIDQIHDRMPVVIKPDSYESWLNCDEGDYFGESVKDFEFYPVSTVVNSSREEGKGLIQPL